MYNENLGTGSIGLPPGFDPNNQAQAGLQLWAWIDAKLPWNHRETELPEQPSSSW
jgi:hypothetical protein